MTKHLLRLRSTLFSAALFPAVYVLAILLAMPSVYADNKSDMAKLQKDIAELQKELKKVQGARSNVQHDLQKNEMQMNNLQKKMETIQQEIGQENKQLDKLRQERDGLHKAKEKQQHQAAEQIKAAYQLGQQPQFKVFLNQESPERISRMMKYHHYFMAAHAEKMKTYLDTIAQLSALEPQIAERTTSLNRVKEQLDKQRDQLSQTQQQRKQALAKINNTLSTKDRELQELQEDRRELQKLLQRVARTSTQMAMAPRYVPLPNAGEKFSSRKGLLPWPAQGPIRHRFGGPQMEGQLQWNGILIHANAGQEVIAVHYGRVVFADHFRGQGLLLIVDHGEGFLTLYAHNQSLLKKAGDAVKAGEMIANVGTSSGQNQSGLYFEIRHQGKAIDPAIWLARA
jgi:murein hydrolase activator